MVASDESLTNMAFDDDDHAQAAKIYDNLNNSNSVFYTALRLLSKADWSARVDFEDHIVHQAMIAVAHRWNTGQCSKSLLWSFSSSVLFGSRRLGSKLSAIICEFGGSKLLLKRKFFITLPTLARCP